MMAIDVPQPQNRLYVDCGLFLHDDMLFYEDMDGVVLVLVEKTGPYAPLRFPKTTAGASDGKETPE